MDNFSDNLGIDEAHWSKLIEAKIEAQKWCLGFTTNLKYHQVINGTLIPLNAPEIEGEEDFERREPTGVYETPPTGDTAFIQMPSNGPGWVSNPGTPDWQRWGTPRTVQAIIAICKEWKARGYTNPIVVGDISLRGGGNFPPHVSHRFGIDFDVRPPTKNWKGRVFVGDGHYDRELTREFIQLIKNNGIAEVDVIGFQDPIFVGEGLTKDWSGHRDHLHVRFKK